eukprot:CAMPEP_0181351278 /NCGR_PEP_ID=MMETSP1106-20121128/1703_1 /TAXON_ID=81844 /ORGANISM="Mantoniella antarctica, Strain SL-175" /LENGTH=407 /DNA_ID=CAMNT_0023463785 /DNA_START=36 /DNA_END=1256 /DNA_ORIENTATION=-
MGGEGVAGGEGVLPAMSRAPATAAVARNGIGAAAGVRADSGIGIINGIGTGEGEDKPTVRHSHVVPGVAVTVAGRYGASTDRPVRAPRASASKIRSNGNGALTDRSAPVRRSYESINHSDRSRPHSQGSDIGSVGASASAGGGSGMSSRVGSRGNSRVSSARGDPKPQGHVVGHAAAVAHVPTAAPDHQRAVAAGATTSTTRRSAALGNLTSRRRASRPGSATADGDDGSGGGRAPGASAPAVGGVLASTPVRVTHSSGSNGGDSSKMTDKVQDKVLNKVSDKTSNKVADKAPTQGKRGGPPPSASAVNRAGSQRGTSSVATVGGRPLSGRTSALAGGAVAPTHTKEAKDTGVRSPYVGRPTSGSSATSIRGVRGRIASARAAAGDDDSSSSQGGNDGDLSAVKTGR